MAGKILRDTGSRWINIRDFATDAKLCMDVYWIISID